MRKLQILALLATAIFAFQNDAFSKVKFTVRLAPDSVTYQIYLRPDQTWNAPLNTTNSAQVTLVVPTGGFAVSNLTSVKGTWANNVTVVAPAENPGFDYFAFALTGSTTQILYTTGVEVLLFTFKNSGTCTGEMHIIETTDPFYPPNNANVASGNQIGVFGGGPGNSWSGNYDSGDSDCTVVVDPPPGCQDVWDDALLPDSVFTCGVCGTNLPLNYSGDSISWSPNVDILCLDCPFPSVFPSSNFKYTVKVPKGDGCFRFDSIWVIVLPAPVFELETVQPSDCQTADGQVVVHLKTISGNYDFAINQNSVFQTDSIFSNLDTGVYRIYVRDDLHNCLDLKFATLDCDTVPVDPPPVGMASVAGWVFKDCAAPLGVFGMNESGLGGKLVELSGADSLGAPVFLTKNTAADGSFKFENLFPGNYNLKFAGGAGLIFSPKNAGSDPLRDSDADPVTGATASFSIHSYQNFAGWNAGLRDTAAPQITILHPLLAPLSSGDTLFLECGATTVFDKNDAAATDNCDPDIEIEFVEDPPEIGDCSEGWLARMHCGFRATDGCGNVAEWWFSVIVRDMTAPVLLGVPTDLTLASGENFPPAAVVTADDFCSPNLSVVLRDTLEITLCDSILTRIWAATDDCGNATTASQRLILNFCACQQPVLDTLILKNADCGAENGTAEIILTLPHDEFTFSWLPNAGLPNAENNARTDLPPGNFLVFVKDKNDADCFLKLDVEIRDTCFCSPPILENMVVTPAKCGDPTGKISLQIVGNEADFDFSWIPNNGISSNFNATRDLISPGKYLVFVYPKNVDSCFLKLDIEVPNDTVDCFGGPPIDEKSAPGDNFGFSPNGDGMNEFFVIPGLENFPDHILTIFNRWGNQVFSVKNYENNWDGHWEGRPLPDGAYFYLIKTKKELVTGWVQIERG